MESRPALTFVHSPFVGPSSWRAVAASLATAGWTTRVPSLLPAFDGLPPYTRRFADLVWQSTPIHNTAVVIVHSGAGSLLPAILDRAPAKVEGAIMVDALIPAVGTSWRATAPVRLVEQLDGMTEDGKLAEWHHWFDRAMLESLLPDRSVRASFTAELPRVPASYLDESVPHSSKWPPPRCAYLLLSDAYGEQAQQAAAMGWSVRRYPSHHLALIIDGPGVASEIALLLAGMHMTI